MRRSRALAIEIGLRKHVFGRFCALGLMCEGCGGFLREVELLRQ